MTRITKNIAQDVARQVINEKYNKKISDLKKEISYIVISEHDNYYEKSLIEYFLKHPKYYWLKTRLKWNFNPLSNIRYLKIERNILEDFRQEYISEKAKKTIREKVQELSDVSDKKHKEIQEVEIAIYSLRTYKNVSEKLPKLAKHLPKKDKSEIQINYDKINQII